MTLLNFFKFLHCGVKLLKHIRCATIQSNLGAPDVFEQFNAAVQKLEEIQECHLVSGDFDYLLKTRVPDMSAYRKLLGETLLRLPGVNDTRTYVVMEEVKQSNRLVIKTR